MSMLWPIELAMRARLRACDVPFRCAEMAPRARRAMARVRRQERPQ